MSKSETSGRLKGNGIIVPENIAIERQKEEEEIALKKQKAEKEDLKNAFNSLKEEIERKKLDEEITGKIDIKEIEEAFGYKVPRACGFWVTLKIVDAPEVAIRKDGTKSNIILSSDVMESEGYKQSTGLILSIGPDFYRNKYNIFQRFFKWASKFMGSYIHKKIGLYDLNVGEFYAINRYSGNQFVYKGVNFINVNYEVPQTQIEDPQAFRKF